MRVGVAAYKDGPASSMVFKPGVQGLELVNLVASQEHVQEANQKWFLEDVSFMSV